MTMEVKNKGKWYLRWWCLLFGHDGLVAWKHPGYKWFKCALCDYEEEEEINSEW